MFLVNAVILFAVGAVGGLTMAVMHFRTRSAPRALLAAAHGLFAGGGLATLVWVVVKMGGGHGVGIALALFLLAAMGGFTLLSFHLRGRPLPSALIIGHGLMDVTWEAGMRCARPRALTRPQRCCGAAGAGAPAGAPAGRRGCMKSG